MAKRFKKEIPAYFDYRADDPERFHCALFMQKSEKSSYHEKLQARLYQVYEVRKELPNRCDQSY